MGKGKIELNYRNIENLGENARVAMHQAADATLTKIIQAQVIPFDVGTMQNDQTFVDISEIAQYKISIVTSATQANRLYFHPEYNFQTVNNPNAKGGWFEEWIQGEFLRRSFGVRYARLNERTK